MAKANASFPSIHKWVKLDTGTQSGRYSPIIGYNVS